VEIQAATATVQLAVVRVQEITLLVALELLEAEGLAVARTLLREQEILAVILPSKVTLAQQLLLT
jgi:hypothetical protein